MLLIVQKSAREAGGRRGREGVGVLGEVTGDTG